MGKRWNRRQIEYVECLFPEKRDERLVNEFVVPATLVKEDIQNEKIESNIDRFPNNTVIGEYDIVWAFCNNILGRFKFKFSPVRYGVRSQLQATIVNENEMVIFIKDFVDFFLEKSSVTNITSTMRHQGYELIIYLCIKLLEKVMGAASNIPSNVSFGTYDFNTFFNLYYNEICNTLCNNAALYKCIYHCLYIALMSTSSIEDNQTTIDFLLRDLTNAGILITINNKNYVIRLP